MMRGVKGCVYMPTVWAVSLLKNAMLSFFCALAL